MRIEMDGDVVVVDGVSYTKQAERPHLARRFGAGDVVMVKSTRKYAEARQAAGLDGGVRAVVVCRRGDVVGVVAPTSEAGHDLDGNAPGSTAGHWLNARALRLVSNADAA